MNALATATRIHDCSCVAFELSAADREDIRQAAVYDSLKGYAELPMWAAVRSAS